MKFKIKDKVNKVLPRSVTLTKTKIIKQIPAQTLHVDTQKKDNLKFGKHDDLPA